MQILVKEFDNKTFGHLQLKTNLVPCPSTCTQQNDCSAKTSEESFDVFDVLLDSSGGKHKEYELDEQLEERGVERTRRIKIRIIHLRCEAVADKWVHWFSTEVKTKYLQ